MKSILIWLAVSMAAYGVIVPKVNADEVCVTYGKVRSCTAVEFPELEPMGAAPLVVAPVTTYVPRTWNEGTPVPYHGPGREGRPVLTPYADLPVCIKPGSSIPRALGRCK